MPTEHCTMRTWHILFTLLFTCSVIVAKAANDTLTLNLEQADATFLKENLLLLAGQYNLTIAEANIVQARLYPNPVFTAELNAYDPENSKALHIGQSGQKAAAIEQLILLGGKRKTQVELAKKSAEVARLDFEDLLRNLKFQLHSSLFRVQQMELLLAKYRGQLRLLDTIITSYEVQAQRGNIPLNEVVRLKAVYLRLNNDKAEVASNLSQEVANLRLLLHTEDYVKPDVPDVGLRKIPLIDVAQLITTALDNRPDYKANNLQVDIARLNYQLQKKLAIPDVAFSASYDQRGGAFQNQVNAGFSIPLPAWNRNQGNIRAAKLQQEAAVPLREQASLAVRTEVRQAFDDLSRCVREYQKAKSLYSSDFEDVLKGITDNFRKRNISLIEFVDFIESYNESLAEWQRIQTQLSLAAEQINFVTAKDLF